MNDYRYAWRNGPRWAAWYICRHRVIAAIRVLWTTLAHGYIGEMCEVCGRTYLLWHASDELYTAVTGRIGVNGECAYGLFCPCCFDRLADRHGISLRWEPRPLP